MKNNVKAPKPTHYNWGRALLHALPVSIFILLLFYNWFAVADRYAVFLYDHLGAKPFDVTTRTRYWMAGLVADGAAMTLYVAWNLVAGRRRRDYRPPPWSQVWALCAPLLAVGLPFITTRFNCPTLPADLAAFATAMTLLGLALTLLPGEMAARTPGDLAWLALDGLGLVPALILIRALELPEGAIISREMAWIVAFGSVAAGAAWLGLLSWLRRWRGKSAPPAHVLFLAGLALAYLGLPLTHYLFATPRGYKYITTAANFFAIDGRLQLLILSVAALLAGGATCLRQRIVGSLTDTTLAS